MTPLQIKNKIELDFGSYNKKTMQAKRIYIPTSYIFQIV